MKRSQVNKLGVPGVCSLVFSSIGLSNFTGFYSCGNLRYLRPILGGASVTMGDGFVCQSQWTELLC